MHAHLVFVTKYRRDVFSKAILDGMREIFANLCRDFAMSAATSSPSWWSSTAKTTMFICW